MPGPLFIFLTTPQGNRFCSPLEIQEEQTVTWAKFHPQPRAKSEELIPLSLQLASHLPVVACVTVP